jgi:NADPH2:quinone reductase
MAAAGGVGLIVSQWAKFLGLNVSRHSIDGSQGRRRARARLRPRDSVRREDVAKRVREITDGVGVSVVYDSVGKDTFAGSIDSLKRRGLLVCVGTASGCGPSDRRYTARGEGLGLRDAPGTRRLYRRPVEKNALAKELFGHVAARADQDRDQSTL